MMSDFRFYDMPKLSDYCIFKTLKVCLGLIWHVINELCVFYFCVKDKLVSNPNKPGAPQYKPTICQQVKQNKNWIFFLPFSIFIKNFTQFHNHPDKTLNNYNTGKQISVLCAMTAIVLMLIRRVCLEEKSMSLRSANSECARL